MTMFSVESDQIDNTLEDMSLDRPKHDFKSILVMVDEIRTVMRTVSPLLDALTLWSRLMAERDISVFQSVIGATRILKSKLPPRGA